MKGGLIPAMQIMVALRVFASGGFQLDVETRLAQMKQYYFQNRN